MLKVCPSEPCTQGPPRLVVLDSDGADTAGKQNEAEVDPNCSKLWIGAYLLMHMNMRLCSAQWWQEYS